MFDRVLNTFVHYFDSDKNILVISRNTFPYKMIFLKYMINLDRYLNVQKRAEFKKTTQRPSKLFL